MKMRKLLPAVLLAVGALFLLSGCDAMLDAIFQNDVINLDVRVIADFNHRDYALAGSFENVVLMDSSFNVVKSVSQYVDGFDGTYAHYHFNFANLKDGTYYLTAGYYGQIVGFRGSTSNIYDNSGFFVGGLVTFPDKSLGDSSGHTIYISMYTP